MNRFIEGVTKMVNFKISKRKTALKYALLLTTSSFLSFNNAQAGKFKEIPFYEYEGQKETNKFILQFDDDEGRREAGATIEIGKIDNVLQELEISIESNLKKGHKIIGIDFSSSDLNNKKLDFINSFLNKRGIFPEYNLDETGVDLIKEKTFIKPNFYEEETEDSLEIKQKIPQNYKFEVLRSIKIPQHQMKSFHEDSNSDEDM